MELVMLALIFLAGIILIVKGGDWFVDAASWIAEVSGIPKLIVGATIVSLATTLPELLVSAMAAAQGKVDMAVGNAVGSVTANIGLIMAVSILFMPGKIRRGDYLLKSILMLSAAALLSVGGMKGEVGLALSLPLIGIFAVFTYENVRGARRAMAHGGGDAGPVRERPGRRTVLLQCLKFIVGAGAVVVGADLLVDSASALARLVGISERVIGVTIVAIGTSLPELVTTITAIVKKQSALSVGNILGANILDLTLILPLSALISGKSLPVSAAGAGIDLPACLLVGAIAVVPSMIFARFQRWQGAVLLAVYGVYVVMTCCA